MQVLSASDIVLFDIHRPTNEQNLNNNRFQIFMPHSDPRTRTPIWIAIMERWTNVLMCSQENFYFMDSDSAREWFSQVRVRADRSGPSPCWPGADECWPILTGELVSEYSKWIKSNRILTFLTPNFLILILPDLQRQRNC